MKKRLFSIVLSLCMVLALMPVTAFAETSGSTEDGFSYTISDAGEVTITRYTGSATEITIPGTIQSNPVKAIGDFAFIDCAGLTSINIPAGVTSIGNSAFESCNRLTSIYIPSSVTSIGHQAFKSCYSLTSINIPAGVTSIGNSAFAGCSALTSINIPAGVTSIGYNAFHGCKSFERIFMSDGLDVSNAGIRNEATKVRYSLNQTTGEVTITKIELGTDKESVDIPETICGYPVISVVESEQSNVGDHKCAGDTATCLDPKTCSLCGNYFSHKYTKEDTTIEGALKTAGTCTTEATYYYSCSYCNSIERDENHTFKGDKDSSKHTGGTEIRGAKSATCTEEGYTGDVYCKSCEVKLSTGSSINKLPHDLVNTPAKDATVIETGNEEYWQCKDCKKYFADEKGTNEIKFDDTVISKLSPEIIEGMGQSITEDEKKALTFRSNALFDDFDRVELDYETLNTEYYTAESGSIIVTLDADYVATLPVGEHTIGIVSESGTAETTFTVAEKAATGTSDDSDKDSESDKDSVKTGDDANLALWIALIILSGAGITGTAVYTRRKRTNE